MKGNSAVVEPSSNPSPTICYIPLGKSLSLCDDPCPHLSMGTRLPRGDTVRNTGTTVSTGPHTVSGTRGHPGGARWNCWDCL